MDALVALLVSSNRWFPPHRATLEVRRNMTSRLTRFADCITGRVETTASFLSVSECEDASINRHRGSVQTDSAKYHRGRYRNFSWQFHAGEYPGEWILRPLCWPRGS